MLRQLANRNVFALLLTGCAMAPFLLALPPAKAAEQIEKDQVGPWDIEAVFHDKQFERCSISREVQNDVTVSFDRTSDGLHLILQSPNWKLDPGKTYPVKMKLGRVSFDSDVAAKQDSVSVAVDDKKFASALHLANTLDVVAAGDTIHVPLDASSAALDRLAACYAKNSKAVETNPFVAPPRQP